MLILTPLLLMLALFFSARTIVGAIGSLVLKRDIEPNGALILACICWGLFYICRYLLYLAPGS